MAQINKVREAHHSSLVKLSGETRYGVKQADDELACAQHGTRIAYDVDRSKADILIHLSQTGQDTRDTDQQLRKVASRLRRIISRSRDF